MRVSYPIASNTRSLAMTRLLENNNKDLPHPSPPGDPRNSAIDMDKYDPVDRFFYVGTFIGGDNKTHKLAYHLRKSLPIVDFETELPFKQKVLKGINVWDAVKYPKEIEQGWARYLNKDRTEWLPGQKLNGLKARRRHLETLWLEKQMRERGYVFSKKEQPEGVEEIDHPGSTEMSQQKDASHGEPSRGRRERSRSQSSLEPTYRQHPSYPELSQNRHQEASRVVPRRARTCSSSSESSGEPLGPVLSRQDAHYPRPSYGEPSGHKQSSNQMDLRDRFYHGVSHHPSLGSPYKPFHDEQPVSASLKRKAEDELHNELSRRTIETLPDVGRTYEKESLNVKMPLNAISQAPTMRGTEKVQNGIAGNDAEDSTLEQAIKASRKASGKASRSPSISDLQKMLLEEKMSKLLREEEFSKLSAERKAIKSKSKRKAWDEANPQGIQRF